MSIERFKHWGELARTVSSIVVVSIMIGAPVWQYFLMPMLVGSISTSMAQDVEDKINNAVDSKIAPITSGLKAIILGNIASLQERIGALEYVRDFQAAQWTDTNRQELAKLRSDLQIQLDALHDIRSAENQ